MSKIIDEVIESFDFERVHTMMRRMDWKWGPEELRVPTKEQIVERAISLCDVAVKGCSKEQKEYSTAAGGFLVTCSYRKGVKTLGLIFAVDYAYGEMING